MDEINLQARRPHVNTFQGVLSHFGHGTYSSNMDQDTIQEEHTQIEIVDVRKMDRAQKSQLLLNLLPTSTHFALQQLFSKIRHRYERVGMELPKVQVGFEHLSVETSVYVGKNALPTLFNYSLNFLEGVLTQLRLMSTRKRKLPILHDVSGLLKPSRMALLLGPPGCGKSTLLKALAGQADPNLKASGSVTYNGHSLSELVPQRVAAYVSQYGKHISDMTVRETLEFSRRCQGVGRRPEMLFELLRRELDAGIEPDLDLDLFMKAIAVEGQETNLISDFVIKFLGLENCADNVIGNELMRGISGGQKKRVTMGEMLVGPSRVFLMDDISTGLDSLTTHHIVQGLSHFVHQLDGTMLISLLQPTPETFELFDDVILLVEGQIAYQGPRELISDIFAAQGFKCPERKSIPEFLQEVFSKKDQKQYWTKNDTQYRYISAHEFAIAHRLSRGGLNTRKETFLTLTGSLNGPTSLSNRVFGLNKRQLWKACFWREWLLMKRNLFTYVFKAVQVSLISIITMTVFFGRFLRPNNREDAAVYMGALFLGLLNATFNAFTELFAMIGRLPVLQAQKLQLLYPCWMVTLSTATLRITVSVVEAGCWVSLTYYGIGYTPEAARFFQQFVVLLFASQMAFGLFGLIGALSKHVTIAYTYGSFILVCFFLSGGFAVTRGNIHKWWIWGYWTSPFMYAYNALAVNEFLSPRWDMPIKDGDVATTIGRAVLERHGLVTDAQWYCFGLVALAGFAVLFNALCALALTYLNFLDRSETVVTDAALYERLINQKACITYLEVDSQSPMCDELFLTLEGARGEEKQPAQYQRFNVTSMSLKVSLSLPFRPMSLSFNCVNYFVDMPATMRQQGASGKRLQLLCNVSGVFRPGILTALIGISGAGKTTLLDVLAGRKTGGYLDGDIRVSGYPKKQETFTRVAGYCEQDDNHSPYVTVEESLLYSAWLRLSTNIDRHKRMMFVKEVMHLVELDNISNTIVGSPGVNGLSTEQRKRLSIAVELVANPSILFMDEPTSGLDARAAAIVMRTIRSAADTGRSVVCTIHQPGIDVFEAFDELLLLKQGGKVIYAGPIGFQSRIMAQYFESIPGVPKLKDGMNPATWILDVTASSVEAHLGIDFVQEYEASSLFRHNKALIRSMSVPAEGSEDLYFPTKYSQSLPVQCIASLWKQHASYIRNPDYNVHRLAFTAMVAFLCGTFFWDFGSSIKKEVELMNSMGGLYAAVIFLGITNANLVQPVADVGRVVFYREKAAGMYSAFSYAFAQLLIEVPYNLLQTTIYGPIVYLMMSFHRTLVKFFWFQLFMFCAFLYCTFFGMVLVGITPNHGYSGIIAAMFYSMWHLFSGFAIPITRIPVWWKWCYWSNPISWTLNGLITSQFGDLDNVPLNVAGGKDTTVSNYLEKHLGFHLDFLWVVAVVHVGIVLLFAILFAISIKMLNFRNR